ncbi:MAG TPA: tRNA (guanosine(37)-N1)-methyltransferase TrmD, partial [Chloroflexota bacterium]|nr:tRNA (guanosine(37)-N1)-methyltransferase TrmD [Chloroflexota bacterium]
MRIDIVTLFPQMFQGPFDESILKRAAQRGLLSINLHDLREFTTDRHQTADDAPFGGGPGQVLTAPPVVVAVDHVLKDARHDRGDAPDVILLAAQGRPLTQHIAADLARRNHLILICAHYEGLDDRVRQHVATDSISIGDYVVTGGEIAAIVVVDAVARLIPGVLGASASLTEESMTGGMLEYPQYTRPAIYRGWKAPKVLLSGDHAAIARWRRDESLRRTFSDRPDLLVGADLNQSDASTLSSLVTLTDATPLC